MNEKLYEALEVCLNALETGADIEAVLDLYPQMADELRPLLEASIQAHSMALPAVPEAARERGRAHVLQRAAELRGRAPRPRRRWSMFSFPRLATSLVIAFIFLLSGTGLVSASTGALPGDNLYPVKRSWEHLRLFFEFSPEGREGLESEFEQERLDEISKLLTEGRNEPIAFVGLVTAQNKEAWKVSGITVIITSTSHLPANTVSVGAPVMVIGHTNAQGFVEADTLEMLGPGASLPPLEPSQRESLDTEESSSHGGEPETNGAQLPQQLGNTTYDFQGVVESMNGNLWTINGQQVNVEFAKNISPVTIGGLVEFKGYYSMAGQFIVTEIEVKSTGMLKKDQIDSSGNRNSGNKSDGESGGGGSGNSEDNHGGDSHEGGDN